MGHHVRISTVSLLTAPQDQGPALVEVHHAPAELGDGQG